MAAIIGALRAVLSLDAAQFESGLGKAQARLAAFSGRMQSLSAKMAKIGGAVSVVGAAISVAIKGQIDAADQAGQMAQKLGVPVDQLTKFAYAAKLSDVSMEQMGTSLGKLAQKMVNSPKLFTDLGVAVKDAQGRMRPVTDLMADLADVFAKMPDGAEKTALAMQLFGKAGADMIPMLNSGKAELTGMMDEAARMGLVVTPEMSQAANQFNDNLDRLTAIASGFALQIATKLTPALAKMSEHLVDISLWFSGLDAVSQQWIAWSAAIGAIAGPVLLALSAIVRFIGAISGFIKFLGIIASATPIGRIVSVLVTGAIAIWYNWDWLKEKFEAICRNIAGFATWAWTTISTSASETIATITAGWYRWKADFQALLDGLPKMFADMWASVITVTTGWVTSLQAKGGEIIEGFKAGIKAAWDGLPKMFTDMWAAVITVTTGWVTSLQAKGREIIEQGFMAGIKAAWDSLPQFFAGLWDQVKAITAQWVADFLAIGGQIVDGLKKGISDKWDALMVWFGEKVNALPQWMRDLLGVQSPSRVFAEIGGFIGMGLQEGIEGSMPGIDGALTGITDSLERAGETWKGIAQDVSGTLKSAFVGAVTGKQGFGSGLKSGLTGLLSGYADRLAGNAFDLLGKAFGFAKGGAFSQGRVMPFATGGIVGSPTIFPMQRGMGLMGEAGPEAIMPLTRVGGKLGVQASGGGAMHVTVTMDPSTGALGAFVRNQAGHVMAEARPGIIRQSLSAVQQANRATGAYLG